MKWEEESAQQGASAASLTGAKLGGGSTVWRSSPEGCRMLLGSVRDQADPDGYCCGGCLVPHTAQSQLCYWDNPTPGLCSRNYAPCAPASALALNSQTTDEIDRPPARSLDLRQRDGCHKPGAPTTHCANVATFQLPRKQWGLPCRARAVGMEPCLARASRHASQAPPPADPSFSSKASRPGFLASRGRTNRQGGVTSSTRPGETIFKKMVSPKNSPFEVSRGSRGHGP